MKKQKYCFYFIIRSSYAAKTQNECVFDTYIQNYLFFNNNSHQTMTQNKNKRVHAKILFCCSSIKIIYFKLISVN